MISASFYGLLIYSGVYPCAPPGLALAPDGILLARLILLIGLTRVYLRVHYATDVLAGFTAGIVWLLIAIPVLRRLETRQKNVFRATCNRLKNSLQARMSRLLR